MNINWSKIQIGDDLKAKDYVPCVMEPTHCFDKDEIARVGMVDEKRIGVWTKFDYIEYFWIDLKDAPDNTTFIGTWFDLAP